MDNGLLKKVQDTELDILKAVADLCEEHGINYFLDSGTLIGAIRHNGFIPWDDDVDISMPYQDYCRFLEIAQTELGERYFVQNFSTDANFHRSYSKVRLKDTLVRPVDLKNWNICHGAWIDIFPMFYSNSDSDICRKRKIYRYSRYLQGKDYYHNILLVEGKTRIDNLKYLFASVIGILPLKLRKHLHKKMLDYVFSKENMNGKYLCRCANMIVRFDANCFTGQKCFHPFEHLNLRIPNDYDKVLRDEYGDYMQIPPEDERGTHGEMEISI